MYRDHTKDRYKIDKNSTDDGLDFETPRKHRIDFVSIILHDLGES